MTFSLFAFAQQYQMDVKTADGQITSYLMTSVNMDSELAKKERLQLEAMLTKEMDVCYGHGAPLW